MGSRRASGAKKRQGRPNFSYIMKLLLGQTIAMALFAMASGKCQYAKPGEIHETCSMECFPDTGSCTETLKIETCPCEGGDAHFESYSTNWVDGIRLGRRRRQVVRGKGEEILNGRLGTCAEMAANCETCKSAVLSGGNYGYNDGYGAVGQQPGQVYGPDGQVLAVPSGGNVVKSSAEKSRKIMGNKEGTP